MKLKCLFMRLSDYIVVSKLLIITSCLFLLGIIIVVPIYPDTEPHIISDTIRSGCEYDYPPYCFVKRNGDADGFSVELFRAVLNAMGKEVTFKTGYWNDLKNDLATGKLDALPLVGRTPEREHIFDFTVPYLPMHGAIVIRENQMGINNLKDLKGKKVAVMKGDNAEEFLRRTNLDTELYTTATFNDALRDLSDGKYDAVIIQKLLALQIIHDMNIRNLRILAPPIDEFRQDFCFAVREGNKELLEDINEGLAIIISDGTFRRLYSKWFAPLEAIRNRSIIVGCDYNYPPWEFLDKDGNPAGYNVELTKAIAKEMDIDISFYCSTWSDVKNKLAAGDIDILQGMFFSLVRAEDFDLSPAHSIVNQVIVTRGNDDDITSIEDLKTKKVIVQEDDIMHEYAIQIGIEDILTGDTPEKALIMLSEGTYDCALLGKIQALYLIEKFGLSNLKVGNFTLISPEYCYAVKKGNTAILADFEEGLLAIKKSGKYREIRKKWFGVSESITFRDIARIVLITVIPAIIIFIIFLVWSITLKRLVNKRTSELKNEIDEHKRAKSGLSRSEKQFETLFSTMAQGVVYQNADGEITSANPAAENILGLSLYQMKGKTSMDPGWMSVDENGDKLAGEMHPAMIALETGNEVRNFIMGVHNPDKNEYKWIIVNAIPQFMDGQDKPFQVFSTFQDITELRKAEENIRKMDKLKSLGVLAGGIAHDFNNILTGIIGNISLLQDISGENEELKNLSEHALKAAESAKSLTKQLLTFSSGGKPIIRTVMIKDLLEESVRFVLSGSKNTLVCEIADNLKPVYADPDQIRQVIQNLVMNAQQAMLITGIITCKAENVHFERDTEFLAEGDYVMFEISDTGSGIRPDIINRIFEPYFTTKRNGTGLGLAIIQSIINKHYGHIEVKSTPGKGSAFTVYLPVSADTPAVTTGTRETMHYGSHGGDILIMDDNEAILLVAEKILSRAGYNVDTAVSGETAIEKYGNRLADDNPYTAVILDLTVPGGIGGKETAQRILSMDPSARLILSSGYSQDSAISEYIKFGFMGVVVKPYRAKELLEELHRVITM